MRDWHPREWSRQYGLAWGLVALGLMPVPPAVGQPARIFTYINAQLALAHGHAPES
jgi:hypothetical protein